MDGAPNTTTSELSTPASGALVIAEPPADWLDLSEELNTVPAGTAKTAVPSEPTTTAEASDGGGATDAAEIAEPAVDLFDPGDTVDANDPGDTVDANDPGDTVDTVDANDPAEPLATADAPAGSAQASDASDSDSDSDSESEELLAGLWEAQPEADIESAKPELDVLFWDPESGPEPDRDSETEQPPRRRTGVLVGAIVAVLVAGGLTAGGIALFSSSSDDKNKTVTFNGATIAAPATVLTSAEASVQALVTARRGASSSDTRCYFTRPTTQANDARKTDVDAKLRCGPVLFVDGDVNRTFLTFSLRPSGTTKSDVTLTPAPKPDSTVPDALPAGVKTVRPDGKKPPAAGTLKVPAPPPAQGGVLLAADLTGSEPAPVHSSQMVSLNHGVHVDAGVVARYGHGDDARSAPAGEQLIAFRATEIAGQEQRGTTIPSLRLVDASGSHALPSQRPNGWIIAAEPVGSSPRLVLAADGYTQTLELPSGKPGGENIAVLARKNRTHAAPPKLFDVALTAQRSDGPLPLTFHATYTGESLSYWVPQFPSSHASSPSRASLMVNLTYVNPSSPGRVFAFDPEFLSLRLPDGTTIQPRDVDPAVESLTDVFDVPATFTTGTLTISGSYDLGNGVTVSVDSPVTLPLSIAAG